MDSALQAELGTSGPLVGFAIEILCLDSTEIRVLDGAIADLTINSQVFASADIDYGVLVPPDEFSDGLGAEAPTLNFSIMPPSDEAAAALLDVLAQMSAVNLYFFSVDKTTGLVVGWDPRGEFLIDVATLVAGQGECIVNIACFSLFEYFFENDEGMTMTDAVWQAIRPGELAFQYTSTVQRQIPWGVDAARSGVVVSGSTSTIGGPGVRGGGGAPDIADAINRVFA